MYMYLLILNEFRIRRNSFFSSKIRAKFLCKKKWRKQQSAIIDVEGRRLR